MAALKQQQASYVPPHNIHLSWIGFDLLLFVEKKTSKCKE